jgi:hypothetical protein
VSAKHKRPFFVFAAVAAICCMVLVTGVRSKADGSGSPEYVVAPPIATAAPPIPAEPKAPVGSAPGSGPETDADPGRGSSDGSRGTDQAPGSFDVPKSDTGPTDQGGPEPDSGLTDVPLPDPPGPVDLDPGTDDELGLPDDDGGKPDKSKARKHRGKHGGKNDCKNDDGDTPVYGHPKQPGSLDANHDDQVECADETEVAEETEGADETEIEFNVEDDQVAEQE